MEQSEMGRTRPALHDTGLAIAQGLGIKFLDLYVETREWYVNMRLPLEDIVTQK